MGTKQNHAASFGQDNTASVSHGCYALIRKLKNGEPIKGLALDLQEQARADLEMSGPFEAMKVAFSMHMGAALYIWGVMNGTTDMDKYLRLEQEFRRLNEKCFTMAQVLTEVETLRGAGRLGDLLDLGVEHDGSNP